MLSHYCVCFQAFKYLLDYITISFALIGLPSPVALGISAGILSQLIPVVGTFLGGIVPVLASISLGTSYILYTLLVLVSYQFVENYLVSPRITKSTMEILFKLILLLLVSEHTA